MMINKANFAFTYIKIALEFCTPRLSILESHTVLYRALMNYFCLVGILEQRKILRDPLGTQYYCVLYCRALLLSFLATVCSSYGWGQPTMYQSQPE